ncbi:MAG: ferrous iron transport protein A [Alphaproteobacteria bacterium]|nr:ferrous iron transport protein A [Alphaproteobacteria bacterium]
MQITLDQLKQGESGKVVSFSKGARSYKQKLLSMGLTLGVEFTVIRVAPLGDPVEINVRGSNLSLRKSEADIVNVEKVKEVS